MAIYELTNDTIREIEQAKFSEVGIKSVDGAVGSEEFVRLASEKARQERKRFDAFRFYLGDDELIVSGNRTFQAIDLLNEAFSDTEISYEKSL